MSPVSKKKTNLLLNLKISIYNLQKLMVNLMNYWLWLLYYTLIYLVTITDLQAIIYKSLLVGNLSTAADIFLNNGKPVEALLLAITAGPETLSRIQNKYLKVKKH